MVDPVTVGSLVAAALSMAAEAVVKGAAGEAVKDAYQALKEKVSHWASGEVTTLEAAPNSKGKQLAVAEIIDVQSEDERNALRVLAETLIARLKEHAPIIGIDMSRVTELEAQFGNIKVTSGIGVRAQDVQGGTLKTGDISVGDPSIK
jgi:hypothetical protein